MKKIFTLLSIIFTVLVLKGQTLEIIDSSTYITGSPSDDILKAKWLVKNAGSDTIDLLVHREIIEEISGTENYFCWGPNCYPPVVDTATTASTLLPGEIDSSFYADYKPKGKTGITKISYCFYEKSNLAGKTCITVTYEAASSTGVAQNSDKAEVFVYPNPAKDQLIVRGLEDKATFRIFDILGSKLLDFELESLHYNTLNVSSLSKGMYIYSIEDSNGKKIKSERLIITQ